MDDSFTFTQPVLSEGTGGMTITTNDGGTSGDIYFSGMGRGCNRLLATFAVDDITWSGTELQSMTIRFVQRCEMTGPPLYGALHWQRPAP